MVEKIFQPGEVVFTEGEASEFVIQILSGHVEISKEINGNSIILGIAGKGEIIGEMGILEGRPRNATVRAKSDLSVLFLGEKEFMKMVGDTPKLAKHLLHRLSTRLRATSNELVQARAEKGDVSAKRFLELCDLDGEKTPKPGHVNPLLSLNDPILSGQIPDEGLSISRFPFIVGRKPDSIDRRQPKTTGVHLQLDDNEPFRLSRVHFMLLHDRDKFMLRDLGSALGTQVNGQFLGVDLPRDSVKLKVGENTIVAGGADSPFSFTLQIPIG